jgi:hypothetical protein
MTNVAPFADAKRIGPLLHDARHWSFILMKNIEGANLDQITEKGLNDFRAELMLLISEVFETVEEASDLYDKQEAGS